MTPARNPELVFCLLFWKRLLKMVKRRLRKDIWESICQGYPLEPMEATKI